MQSANIYFCSWWVVSQLVVFLLLTLNASKGSGTSEPSELNYRVIYGQLVTQEALHGRCQTEQENYYCQKCLNYFPTLATRSGLARVTELSRGIIFPTSSIIIIIF